jgi:hypothetical protein
VTLPVPRDTVIACARAAHEVNLAYCAAMRDHSQLPWEYAPPWARESAIKGVEGALAGATPEQSHASWLEEKRRTGWKYGPVKDAEKKEHPCFLPYAELPAAQRVKDELYVTVVRAVASALGEAVEYDPLRARKLAEALRKIIATEGSRDMREIAREALAS